MNPCMYIIADPNLGMSPGKLAAQVAHAAVEAYRISDQHLIDAWDLGGHYTKIVLQTDNLLVANEYLAERDFSARIIIDEGRTEFSRDLTPTALGVELVDKDDPHTAATFEAFKLYKESQPNVITFDKAMSNAEIAKLRVDFERPHAIPNPILAPEGFASYEDEGQSRFKSWLNERLGRRGR